MAMILNKRLSMKRARVNSVSKLNLAQKKEKLTLTTLQKA